MLVIKSDRKDGIIPDYIQESVDILNFLKDAETVELRRNDNDLIMTVNAKNLYSTIEGDLMEHGNIPEEAEPAKT